MKLLSLKSVALRYFCAVALITLAGLLPNPTGFFLLIPVAIVSLKFIAYDGIARAIKSKSPNLKTSPWLLIGYGVTVGWDMLFVYSANLDEADAGFAFFGTFLVTPWVLGATIVLMVVVTYLTRRK